MNDIAQRRWSTLFLQLVACLIALAGYWGDEAIHIQMAIFLVLISFAMPEKRTDD